MTGQPTDQQNEESDVKTPPPQPPAEQDKGAGPIAEPGSGGSAGDPAGNLGKA